MECTIHYKRSVRQSSEAQTAEGTNVPELNALEATFRDAQSPFPTCGLSLNPLGISSNGQNSRLATPEPYIGLRDGDHVVHDRALQELSMSPTLQSSENFLDLRLDLPLCLSTTVPVPSPAHSESLPAGPPEDPTPQLDVQLGTLPPLFTEDGVSSPRSSPMPSTPTLIRRNRVSRTFINGIRLRATNAKPHYGFMNAKKGSSGYKIVRTGSLLGPLPRHQINHRFTRTIDRILLNCEKVSNETGCWLYIAAHHPSVQGEHVHWMSPAMRDDLPPNTVDRLNNTSSSLFSALKLARRQNVAEVELEAGKARAERDAAQKTLVEQQTVIAKLAATLRSQGLNVNSILGPDGSIPGSQQ
ncbi:hypothetical protein AAF712_015001 [Marasmius tenuissimus]|uniref:Uncharacterized protein n=1 Tax=Marasmius tenuissimus TaxID=585030 RepID=A0ABR2ZAK5_9AGAR